MKERASDIHIEPEEKEVIVRYRIDGELYIARRAARAFMNSIISRIKIESALNIAEKRLPQDGRITKKIAGKSFDIRVSTIPTSRGYERIVMRLLNKSSVLLDLPDLGFSPREYALMDGLIRRPDGIILVTGPTGSGKTTTLYACINRINQPNLNILTAEDPVEYEIQGIHQVHVQPKIGLTFASALRAFLRQDPDIVMVGEIRDHETLEIAINASLTGHLVLSTIHTNDAAGAITRTIDMGAEPFLLRSSVIGILAQRLVRVLCPHCKYPYPAEDFELEELGLTAERMRARTARRDNPASRYFPRKVREARPARDVRARQPADLLQGQGCDAVHQHWLQRSSRHLRAPAGGRRRRPAHPAQGRRAGNQARGLEQGMDTLRDDGARKVLAGMTTVEEVLAATQEDVDADPIAPVRHRRRRRGSHRPWPSSSTAASCRASGKQVQGVRDADNAKTLRVGAQARGRSSSRTRRRTKATPGSGSRSIGADSSSVAVSPGRLDDDAAARDAGDGGHPPRRGGRGAHRAGRGARAQARSHAGRRPAQRRQLASPRRSSRTPACSRRST